MSRQKTLLLLMLMSSVEVTDVDDTHSLVDIPIGLYAFHVSGQ